MDDSIFRSWKVSHVGLQFWKAVWKVFELQFCPGFPSTWGQRKQDPRPLRPLCWAAFGQDQRAALGFTHMTLGYGLLDMARLKGGGCRKDRVTPEWVALVRRILAVFLDTQISKFG